MFQSFARPPVEKRLLGSRMEDFVRRLKDNALDGYVITHADAHQSEYLPADQERLTYLTGFTGSAGWAIIHLGKGNLFVDGRYLQQAAQQIDGVAFSIVDVSATAPAKWLKSNLKPGQRIGYHGYYLTIAQVRKLKKACQAAGAELVSCPVDLVDQSWDEDGRPAPAKGQVFLRDEAFAGESISEKLKRLSARLGESGADAALLTLTDSIAWAFNIRGNDVAHNPVALAFALLKKDAKPVLWIDGEKLSNSVRSNLSQSVDIEEITDFGRSLEAYAETKPAILIDPDSCADAVRLVLQRDGATLIEGSDPVVPMKARKNPVELAGMRRAHLRDGAAMVRFLYWLDQQDIGSVSEIDAARKLEDIRRETATADGMELRELAFDTISAAGENAALPHYRVMEHHNAVLTDNSLYLVDSGGQYYDGTTDITRTIAIGSLDAERKQRFTQVLRGHIAVATARFPGGTTGAQLDTLARLPLWMSGADFAHGTGHGVGAYLCVHEGPARISKAGHVALEPGMILSNEPGYYKSGHFGIRLENLLIVEEATPVDGGDLPMMGFETLTFCPFDTRAVELDLLSDPEIDWLNEYHHDVFEKLIHIDLLNPEEVAWLSRATSPLMRKSSEQIA